MTPKTTDPAARESRLAEVLVRYVEAVQAGESPDREQILAAHPDIADELAEFFAGYDQVNCLASPLRPPAEAMRTVRRPDLTGSAAGGVRTAPAAASSTSVPAELGQLGDFRLLREVGRGGMGIVYEAEQISLRRRVALKVLPFASAIDPRLLQRFRSEAEAAAYLHHSNIVPVFAVGQERGVHYYAMQFIDGKSLAALISELRPETSGERPTAAGAAPAVPALRTTQASAATEASSRGKKFYQFVARIGKQAAEALEYAHVAGVVHRDIKPANLLLDGRGHLWVTDFGLAQFRAGTTLTMTGEMLGTLRYASPEQTMARRGVVDHRTDIYSLGATLYELLTLRPVFDGQDRQELLHQITFGEVRAPRTFDRSIPLELETIVLKALAKSPAERYATAQELADDLQRFLDDKPVLARRPTLSQRVQKWARRHPSFVVAAVVLLVLVAAGSLTGAVLIQRERAETEAAYERERLRAKEADERFRLAQRSVGELIRLAEDELADLPHLQGMRRRLLEAALNYYQEFLELRKDDPDAKAELAATRDHVKKLLADLATLQGVGLYLMLREKSVLDDLGAEPEQRWRLAEWLRRDDEQRPEKFRGFNLLNAEEKRKRFLELARANEVEVTAILRPEQIRRLHQIDLQRRGLSAFRDPEIAARLKLTADQREKIRDIEIRPFFIKRERPPFDAAPPLPKGLPKLHEERHQAMMKEALAVLTPQQQSLWREMTGRPFEGPLPLLPFGPPPQFGPPGGGKWFKEVRPLPNP